MKMIIDCHVHIGRNEHIKCSVKELLVSMDINDIDKALVFAGDLNDAPNDWVMKEIAQHRDRLDMVAAVHPLKWKKQSELQDDAKRIAGWYAEGKIKAAKFYTGYDHYYAHDDYNAGDYLFSLENVGCPAIFHCGDCLCSIQNAKLKYAHPLHIDDVAVDYPKMNFIIAHMAFPWHRDAAEVCYKNPNVYSDISGFVYGKFNNFRNDNSVGKFNTVLQEFLDICPSNKLLFGTDFPISDQGSYLQVMSNVLEGTLSSEKLSENTKKVFNIK